jgi:hypothetical protein
MTTQTPVIIGVTFHPLARGRIFNLELCPIDCHDISTFRSSPISVAQYILRGGEDIPEILYASKHQEIRLFTTPPCQLTREVPLKLSLHLADDDMTLLTSNSPTLNPVYKVSPQRPYLKNQGTSFLDIQVCWLSSKFFNRRFVLKFEANIEGCRVTHVTRPFLVKSKPPPPSALHKRQRTGVPLASPRQNNQPLYNQMVEIHHELSKLTFRLSNILDEETFREMGDLLGDDEVKRNSENDFEF